VKRATTLAFLLVAATTLANAETIQFVGPATTVNDGSSWVMPYQITIDGVTQLVTCFDYVDDVNDGDTWTSSILNIGAAAVSGFFNVSNAFSLYERVAWLSAQAYNNADEQIGLQHAIWNVFGATFETGDSLKYEAAADAAAAGNYAGFDFSSFRFIQQPGAASGQAGVYQAFVFQSNALSVNSESAATPEPAATILLASGLAFTFVMVRRRRVAA
jgi:hypothetical protein